MRFTMLLIKLNNLRPDRFANGMIWILESGLINKDVWLAGGALRTLIDQNETICDYDLFFNNQEYDSALSNKGLVGLTRQKLIASGFKLIYECPEGKLYTYEKEWIKLLEKNINLKVQLITEHFYDSTEELLSNFDLSPTYFCTDGEYLWTSREAIESVRKKVCSLLKLTYPISSFKRIIKYS